jgi:anaphase-promoting complex subunit 8
VAEYARSAVYLARFHLHRGGGDLALAAQLMEKVAGSNAEDADIAADLLRKVHQELRGTAGSGHPLERMETAEAAAMNFVH